MMRVFPTLDRPTTERAKQSSPLTRRQVAMLNRCTTNDSLAVSAPRPVLFSVEKLTCSEPIHRSKAFE